MSEEKLLGLLGLASRGGNLVYGQTRCMDAIRHGSLRLLVLDGAVSDNTRKAFADSCRTHQVPYILLGERDVLGARTGRPSNKIVGVTDAALARGAMEKYEQESGGGRV